MLDSHLISDPGTRAGRHELPCFRAANKVARGADALDLPWQLAEHLSLWAGGVPRPGVVAVVPNPRVALPGWSGSPALLAGVLDPAGGAVISVPPDLASAAVTAAGADGSFSNLATVVGRPGHAVDRVVFRWCVDIAPLPPVGQWVDSDSPRLPEWLAPFGGKALVVFGDDGGYVAGVGIKRHDRFAHEISVGTEAAARGRGLARRLVTQAARRIRETGAIPTYLHHPENRASDRVATAAGFVDKGWSALILSDGPTAVPGDLA